MKVGSFALALTATALLCGAAAAWSGARRAEPTVCDDGSCRCDANSRVICSCTNDYDEVTIRPVGPYKVLASATEIIIDGCARVYFFPDSINGTLQLRGIELRNVRHVDFKESSVLWAPYSREHMLSNPGLRILIDNCTIDNIASHAFKGRIDDIVIRNSVVRSVRPFAFSSLTGVKTIEFTNNDFETIDIQTFKKFTVNNFVLRGGRAHVLPSRFLSDVEVTDTFRLDGVRIDTVQSMAFLANGPRRVSIENNVIGVLEGDAFHMRVAGAVTFRNNTVGDIRQGAFLGLSVEPRVVGALGLQELLVDNNTVREAQLDSFHHNRSGLRLRIDGLNLARTCECALAHAWLAAAAVHGGTVTCNYTLEGRPVSLATYADSRCGKFKENFWIFVAAALATAALVATAVVCLVVRRESDKKKKLNIVMPDGKTYRETELHVVVERAELLTTDL